MNWATNSIHDYVPRISVSQSIILQMGNETPEDQRFWCWMCCAIIAAIIAIMIAAHQNSVRHNPAPQKRDSVESANPAES
jgi:hypothetical protein